MYDIRYKAGLAKLESLPWSSSAGNTRLWRDGDRTWGVNCIRRNNSRGEEALSLYNKERTGVEVKRAGRKRIKIEMEGQVSREMGRKGFGTYI
jgi:hypothetical protein